MFLCIFATKYLTKFGVPILILFIGVGMLMGSEGVFGVYFDNPSLTREIGNIALCIIIFAGGLDLNWRQAKQALASSVILATLGVLLTAIFVGLFTHIILGMPLMYSFLLGAIVSSTDAASVFAILRAQKMKTKGRVSQLLEFESGSNDPMAYILTITIIGMIMNPQESIYGFVLSFIQQFGLGMVLGILIGFGTVQILNRIHHIIDSMYLILGIILMLFAYSVSSITGGNSFLTVYIAGIIIGNSSFVRKTRVIRFFDGLSWLAQIILFVTLGLQVFPSRLLDVSISALVISVLLIFIVRPLVVIPVLSLFKMPFKEQLFISFVGFRGAASIVFATYPLTSGLLYSQEIFDMVFFIALSSLIIQGLAMKPVAKYFGIIKENDDSFQMQNFSHYVDEISDIPLLAVYIPNYSPIVGKTLRELELPDEIRIVTVRQTEGYITPRGNTIIRAGDRMLITSLSEDGLKAVCQRLKLEY
jgi:cell volume regulation protein A